MRDEKESSKDFIISQNKNINIHKLAFIREEFSPAKTEDHSIALRINNPKVDQTYNMYLYVRENENGENLSEPLKIVYKIKEDEEAAIRKRDEEERQKEIERPKELERQEELERPKELERQKEVLEKEKELEKQKEELEKDEIDMGKVNTIFEDLETEYNLSCILEKNEIIAKIIELKCDKNKIKDWIDEVM